MRLSGDSMLLKNSLKKIKKSFEYNPKGFQRKRM